MNKISNYILILSFFLLTNCGYEAVLNNQNYQFSINVNKINGDQKINSLIINSFKQLKENEKKYNLSLTSNKEKLIISKDSKGDPSIFEIKINVNYVVKKDGDKVNFDRDKIAKSVELALRKRPVDTDAKEKLISRIVNDVEGMGENEISSNVIGEAVMKALYTIDKVAYVRFASVYRDFRETKDFEQFLDTIDNK